MTPQETTTSDISEGISSLVRTLGRKKTPEEYRAFLMELGNFLNHDFEKFCQESEQLPPEAQTERSLLHLASLLDVADRELSDLGESHAPETFPQRIDDLRALTDHMKTVTHMILDLPRHAA